MPLRLLSASLLVIAFAVYKLPLVSHAAQESEGTFTGPKWEYKVLRLDGNFCASENEVSTQLNSSGQQGWELIGYERLSSPFPRDAEGTMLIRPAASGPGKEVTPPVADSFQGEISMKMPPVPLGECRLLFKRQAHKP